MDKDLFFPSSMYRGPRMQVNLPGTYENTRIKDINTKMKHQRNKEHIIKEKMGKYLKYLEKRNGKWP